MAEAGSRHWTEEKPEDGLLTLGAVSLIVGAAAGLVGAAFRASLDAADRLRDSLIASSHGAPLAGFLLIVAACASATAAAAWLVRRFSPPASGSEIPHAQAVLRGEVPPAPAGLAPVKFAGGVLAIGAGLALGREGPTIQMGASIAVQIGRVLRLPRYDFRALLARRRGRGPRDRLQRAARRRRLRPRGIGPEVRPSDCGCGAGGLGDGDRGRPHAARRCSAPAPRRCWFRRCCGTRRSTSPFARPCCAARAPPRPRPAQSARPPQAKTQPDRL